MTHLQGFENASHVLEVLVSIHERLATLYGKLRDSADAPLAKMLLEHLQGREQRMVETLDNYEGSAPDAVLKTWIQIPWPEDPDVFFRQLEARAGEKLDTQQIFELASGADDFISRLLQHLEQRCEIPEVCEVFTDLQQGEKQERIALSKAINSLREM